MTKRIPLFLWVLAPGLLLLIGGATMNYFSAYHGRIWLHQGNARHLVLQNERQDSLMEQTGLGFNLTLDSVRIDPHTPAFEFRIEETTTGPEDPSGMPPERQTKILKRHPVEMMKPIRIEASDFYFRANAYYPDFEFSYTYPEYRDTIRPEAPGMLLRLHTAEGPAIVTLRKDQPGRHTLGDIVGLGTSFTFFWTLAEEDVRQAVDPADTAMLKILFSGSDHKLYRVREDSISVSTFDENQFYSLSGNDSLGFTVLFSVADVNLLKAEPSSKSESPVNPVVSVEVWKEGGPAREVFLYPKMTGRTGGQFEVPGSNYTLLMEEDPGQALRHCTCYLTVSGDTSGQPEPLQIIHGKAVSWNGYKLLPEACRDDGLHQAGFILEYRPGSRWIMWGWVLASLGLGLLAWKMTVKRARGSGQRKATYEKDQPQV